MHGLGFSENVICGKEIGGDFRVNTEGAGNVGFHYGNGSGGCRAFPF